MKLKQVLAFVNNKGGVGKTTSVQNIASGILRKYPDARVLCIDMDPQGNLSDQLGWENTRRGLSPDASARTLAVALSRGLDGHLPVVRKADRWYYVPSCPQLECIEPTLNASLKPKQMLGLLMGKPVDDISGDGIQLVQDYFDYVLIDCAPSLSTLTINALDAADSVLIPIHLDPLSIKGLGRILNAVKEVNAYLNPDLRIKGILPVKVNDRTTLARSLVKMLQEKYGSFLMHSRIRDCIRVKEGQAFNRDIFDYAPTCTAAIDYAAVVDELMKQ